MPQLLECEILVYKYSGNKVYAEKLYEAGFEKNGEQYTAKFGVHMPPAALRQLLSRSCNSEAVV